jgi:hypothetical protein
MKPTEPTSSHLSQQFELTYRQLVAAKHELETTTNARRPAMLERYAVRYWTARHLMIRDQFDREILANLPDEQTRGQELRDLFLTQDATIIAEVGEIGDNVESFDTLLDMPDTDPTKSARVKRYLDSVTSKRRAEQYPIRHKS